MNSVPKPKKPNRAAKEREEWSRIYGSRARVAFVKDLWCVTDEWCGLMNGAENAHIISGGTSRKADARWIVPLCHDHHHELHQIGAATFEAKYGINLKDEAAKTEGAWQSHLASTTEPTET